jgi:pyruvate/2-oxoacid:ferredoxin oxidoreductase beta subunit
MAHFIDKVTSHRKQVVTVKGGSGASKKIGIDACEGRSAHGFFGQEAEVASGIARFVRGQAY